MKILCLLCAFFVLINCQNNSDTAVVSKEPVTQATTQQETKASTLTEQAKSTLTTTSAPNPEEITQQQPLTTYIINKMTKGIWYYDTAIVGGKPEKQYKGKWIKFNPDNTTVSGFYEEEGHAGKWVYDGGKDILTVLEGGELPNYNQWKLQFSTNSDDLIIWVGTKRFQNNNTQIKMLRRTEKPKK